MKTNIKKVVSMLIGEEKLTLFTSTGEVLEMKNDGPHMIDKIVEYLQPKITGTTEIEINLSNYLSISKAIVPDGYESKGIILTQMIEGKEVQGIFYPSKVQVAVEHEGEEITIPDVEKLSKHADRASDDNSPAVRNFLRRIAPVVKDRLHSAEDLMSFIEKSDLPLTNDGKIIGYKRVNQHPNKPGVFVDCHSGKVTQQVGSHVWMDVDAVDPSRNQSCSHGLHVANLGYLSGFSGSHTLIVLVDPANFIAVPHGETNKARVCAYDIIGVMSTNSHKMVNSGSYVSKDETFKDILAQALEGNHIQPFEAVHVGTNGAIVSIDPIKGMEIPMQGIEETTEETKTTTESLGSMKPKEKKQKDVIKMANKSKSGNAWDQASADVISAFSGLKAGMTKTEAARKLNVSTRTLGRWMEKYQYDAWVKSFESSMTVSEKARDMFVRGAFSALAAFKSAKKKSYAALGFAEKEIKQIEKALA